MDDPRSKEVELFGETCDLNLTAANFRLAQMEGAGLDPDELQTTEDFELGSQLAYIAVLPSTPDDKTERDVMEELIKQGAATDAAQHCLAQYLEMQQELGKFLAETVSETLTESLTSEE